MTYSIIGIISSILLLITNRDLLLIGNKKDSTDTERNYRHFLLWVLGYYITDAIWGFFDIYKLTKLQFIDTTVYFVAMAAAVLLWTRYVISYLKAKNIFERMLRLAGNLFFVSEIIVILVNIFYPIMFWFDEKGDYHAGTARHITLAIQILMFLLTSIYTLRITAKTEGSIKRRHLTVGLFGIVMIVLIGLQIAYPLLPFYAMGYMLGICLLHSFVVEDEKEEYRRGLEEAIVREQIQSKELSESREALKNALAAAENANKAKTAFLSNMSHEIRTPMNAIIGLNNIALNDDSASDKVKDYLGKIKNSAQHLLGIINDILDMSRIESGHMTVNNDEFSLIENLDQVNTMIREQCRDKDINYEYKIKGHIDDFYVGDGMKIKQVLINILGNAVKFTPKDGKISFIIEEGTKFENKASLKFIISDTGIGMSKDFLPHIFDAFSQEDTSSTSKYGSTGLGMPITKSIVELMNGNIEVTSEKGKGTTFTVTITLGISDRKADENNLKEQNSNKTTISEQQTSNQINKDSNSKADLKGCRVLLAEDMPVNSEIMKMVLAMKEIEVELAENGKIAVEMFANHEAGYYNAILMDMRMPEMDGLEATKVIRALEREDAKKIPIIALTANAFEEDVQKSLQAGLNAHLSKPVEPEALYETLEKLIFF